MFGRERLPDAMHFIAVTASVAVSVHHIESSKALLSGCAIADDNGCFADCGMFEEPRLDLLRLDAEAAELHLKITPSLKLNGAIKEPSAQIAGFVHPRANFLPIRIWQKTLCGKLRPSQVSSGHAGTSDI